MSTVSTIKERGKVNITLATAQWNDLLGDYPSGGNPSQMPKSTLLNLNFNGFGGTTVQAGSNLISDIDVSGKDDSYLRVDFEIDQTNLTADTYFTLDILLGMDGNDTPVVVSSQAIKNSSTVDIPVVGNFLMSEKLGDYHWYKVLPTGIAIADAAIKLRFTNEGIKDNNVAPV